ncbi:MAG: asparaginase domain-containing protein [Saprospiraceae bacterium]
MKLYILYTGGTIGCVGNPLSPMSGPDFEKAFNANLLPVIQTQLPGTTVQFDYFAHTLDSTNMQPSEWVNMAQKIYSNYKSFDAFMVLHGTDTMAWTASALSFLLPGLDKPVIVTGSQLPLFFQTGSDPSNYQLLLTSDAVRNVEGATRFLEFGFPEVGLYFADHLYRGNRVVKANASEFPAFAAPNYHTLGEYGVIPRFYNQYVLPSPKSSSLTANYSQVGKNLQTIANNISSESVLQFLLFPAYYSEPDGANSLMVSLLENIQNVSPALKGIIFEAYGEGNIPDYQSMQTLLKSMHSKGQILVDCTQVFAGDVNYNAYATGAWLKDAGVISGYDMTPIAALTKLIVLLSLDPSASQEEIEYQMGEDFAGELSRYYSISGYQNQFLMPGEVLYSINGNYMFENTNTGSLVLYDTSDSQNPKILWSENLGVPGRLVMQSDNNLVFYDQDKNPLWATNTAAIGMNSYFKLGNDGSLGLYNLDTNQLYHFVFKPQTQTC